MNDDPLKLDNLQFEQLIEQARALIPRFAPQWTDHNVHDPGMTILDLLSWIVDQQIYQVGFVSDRHLSAFAALLGVRSKLAQPATGIVWVNKQQGAYADQHVVLVDADLQHGTSITPVLQPDLSFVLEADVHVCAAQPILDDYVRLFRANSSVNLTQIFSQPNATYELEPRFQSESALEFNFDQPLVKDGKHPVSLGIEVDAIQSHRSDQASPWGPLVVEYRTNGSPWQRVNIIEDRTRSLIQTGVVLMEIPPIDEAGVSSLRLRLDLGYYPVPVRISKVEINALPIVQLQKVNQQVLGVSNGLPDQAFVLPMKGWVESNSVVSDGNKFTYKPVIQVMAGGRIQNWQQSSDLSKNHPDEHVFQFDQHNEQVIFGNSINGAVPPHGAEIRHKDFFITNGAEGNLKSGFDWELAGVAKHGPLYGTNYDPLYGGEDAWDIDQLMAQARRRIRHRNVMLSNQDLLERILNLDGFAVARADLLVGYDPSLPDMEVEGTRTVVVTPQYQQGEDETSRTDLRRYLQEIQAAIESNRVMGEKLNVITHQQVPISLKATLLLEPDKDAQSIKSLAINWLNARLALILDPLLDIEPWPLGRPVTRSEIKALLAKIPEVIAVPQCDIAHENEPFSDIEMIELMRDEVAVIAGVPEITIEHVVSH